MASQAHNDEPYKMFENISQEEAEKVQQKGPAYFLTVGLCSISLLRIKEHAGRCLLGETKTSLTVVLVLASFSIGAGLATLISVCVISCATPTGRNSYNIIISVLFYHISSSFHHCRMYDIVFF